MSASPGELSRFLAELGSRRQRLLAIATTADTRENQLLDELTELSEQLIVAEEELRVQQEELDSTRRRLESAVADIEILFGNAGTAYVLTDVGGVVVQANRAAGELTQQPAARVRPRPIATWFQVPDRARVRTMISMATRLGTPQEASGLLIQRPDGSRVEVKISVVRVSEPASDRPLLRWELRHHNVGTILPAVPDEMITHRGDRQLAYDLADLAGELAGLADVSAVLSNIADRAVRLVPGADSAGVALLGRRGVAQEQAFAGHLAEACDTWQFAAKEGPSFAALTGEVVRIDDLETGQQWLRFSAHSLRLGARSLLAIPLTLRGLRRAAVLTIYAQRRNAFDDDAQQTASILALHAAVALDRAVSEEQFHNAVESRQLIGQAIGILIERDRLTPEAAFQLLSHTSQDRNMKVRDLAQVIVSTGLNPSDIRPA